MYSIQANPALPFNASDFGLKFVGSTLQVPPQVFNILYRSGVRGPESIVPMMDAMPSAFTGPLGLSRDECLGAKNAIARLLKDAGIVSLKDEPDFKPSFGALPPPVSVRLR